MSRSTWVAGAAGSPFPITNLPYGAFTVEGVTRPRLGVAIGEHVLDLAAVIPEVDELADPTLNRFMALGPSAWGSVRERVGELLSDPAARAAVEPHLAALDAVQLHLPFAVADYVDFYSSEHHARNLGRIFRPGQPELTPNWKHLPIGYHGRSGTVRVSGTPVTRPAGQRLLSAGARPEFGPSRRLDIEAEIGWVVGVPSELGHAVPLAAFRDHVFGVCLVNDWSARDLQSWEYVPLGPFLGKSFLTSVSPWVVPLAALDDAWVAPPERDEPLLGYLDDEGRRDGLDLTIEVRLNGSLVSRPAFAGMYWTAAQQLAHLTSNGAALRTGDLYASGTVSGTARDECGSFIEMSWNATEPLRLDDGSERTFLENGDEVTITATAPGVDGGRIGLGAVTGRVRAA